MRNPLSRTLIFSLLLLHQSNLIAQEGCAKDTFGKIYCAPTGGFAIAALRGVVCAPGRCVADGLGYLKCSSELGGSAIADDLGRVVCTGKCINPSKEF